ncbi:MAG: hypothetical protein HND48_16625 [Chloroflexi bacterium]|nr:hypothetical protein [Chloroflexota bacterium]
MDITGDLWQTMGRAIVEADSAGESGAVVWTALEAQMKRALADPAEPLPVMIDLTSWDERAESLESFVRHHLDTLADHWPTLAKQDRVAPLISGIEIADPRTHRRTSRCRRGVLARAPRSVLTGRHRERGVGVVLPRGLARR